MVLWILSALSSKAEVALATATLFSFQDMLFWAPGMLSRGCLYASDLMFCSAPRPSSETARLRVPIATTRVVAPTSLVISVDRTQGSAAATLPTPSTDGQGKRPGLGNPTSAAGAALQSPES